MKNRGQVSLMAIVVGGAFTLLASVGGAWFSGSASAQKEISIVNTKVQVVEERENNHYRELQRGIDDIKSQLQTLIEKQ